MARSRNEEMGGGTGWHRRPVQRHWGKSTELARYSVDFRYAPCRLCVGFLSVLLGFCIVTVMLPLPLALAIQQYRGTFLANPKAAFAVAVLLFIVGGTSLFAVATTLGELVFEEVQIHWLSPLLSMLSAGLGACWAGWLNLCWSRRPQGDMLPILRGVTGSRLTVREGANGAIAIVGVVGLAWCLIASTPPRCGKNFAREDVPFDAAFDRAANRAYYFAHFH